ncbi:MAG: DNA cytosine methyltransferase [Acidobacteriota bacterium]
MKNKKFKEPVKPIGTVAELFAGVGGFRIGLARAGFKTVFSNQWEPSTKIQHASSVYVANFGEDGHSSEDIAKVARIPSRFDLLVGGFPCQDYSVAKTLSHAKGIRGKKGVLWWEILRLVNLHKPKIIFLENVDRLLKSPANQRGRDFAVMLRTLGDAGYVVEWRVVNAAEYGFPQRRIRVFIVAKRGKSLGRAVSPFVHITEKGVLAKSLPVSPVQLDCTGIPIDENPEIVSKYFNRGGANPSPFMNSGVYVSGMAYTIKTQASPGKVSIQTLGDILQKESEVDESFYVPEGQLKDWKFLKGAKSIERVHKTSGAKYKYAEGAMAFPDLLTNPSRTILTGEGGSSPSRFKHIIKTRKGFRRLTPVELERLNGFPDNWTQLDANGEVVSDAKRAFFMGNALVVGLIERVGREIANEISKES